MSSLKTFDVKVVAQDKIFDCETCDFGEKTLIKVGETVQLPVSESTFTFKTKAGNVYALSKNAHNMDKPFLTETISVKAPSGIKCCKGRSVYSSDVFEFPLKLGMAFEFLPGQIIFDTAGDEFKTQGSLTFYVASF